MCRLSHELVEDGHGQQYLVEVDEIRSHFIFILTLLLKMNIKSVDLKQDPWST